MSADVSHIIPKQDHFRSSYDYGDYDSYQNVEYSASAPDYSIFPAFGLTAPAFQPYSAPSVQSYSSPSVQQYSTPSVQHYSAAGRGGYSGPAISYQNFNAHHSNVYDIPAVSSFSSYAAPLSNNIYSAPQVSSYSDTGFGGYHYENPIYRAIK